MHVHARMHFYAACRLQQLGTEASGRRPQTLFFSATLHADAAVAAVRQLAPQACWVDLKGTAVLPDTVHVAVYTVDPKQVILICMHADKLMHVHAYNDCRPLEAQCVHTFRQMHTCPHAHMHTCMRACIWFFLCFFYCIRACNVPFLSIDRWGCQRPTAFIWGR